MTRLEYLAAAICFLAWVVAFVAQRGLLHLAGLADLGLYRLYSVAAVLGWVAGNVYVARRRALAGTRLRIRGLLLYLFGPPAFVFVLRAMAAKSIQAEAPLAPIYAFGVYAILFLVPVTLRAAPPRRPRIGR